MALRLTLDRPLDGASAMFAVAAARHLYRAEGLTLTSDAVPRSADLLARVASLDDLAGKTLGVADNDLAIRLRPAFAQRTA